MPSRVGDAQLPPGHTEPHRDVRAPAGERELGLAGRQPPYVYIRPGNAARPSGAERLHHGFLGGEPPGKKLDTEGSVTGLRLLAGGVDPLQKSVAVPLDSVPDPLHFDEVDTMADEPHARNLSPGGRRWRVGVRDDIVLRSHPIHPYVEAGMKKLLIGCLVLAVVLAVTAGAASYYLYRKVDSTISGFKELGTVPELERSVRNKTFSPPSSGALTQAQLDRYLAVQQEVRVRLGTGASEIERKYKTLLAKDSATITDAPELVAAYRDLAKTYVAAKRAQVDALNDAGLSLEEYRWVRRQAYAGLGMPLVEMDVARIMEDIKAGRTPEQPTPTMNLAPMASPVTAKLVAPHRKTLEANAGLAFFGL
jgi:hypothetical protein